MGRARAYLRASMRKEALFHPALLLVLLLVATVWIGYQPTSQAAAGHEKARETSAREATIPVVEPIEPLLPKITPPELPKDRSAAELPPAEIPRLSEMDVIGNMQYLPGTNFRCPGGGPAGGGLTKRSCRSSSDDDPPVVYEVTLVEDDPSTVLWVRADASDATDEAAAEFLGYVADLSLEDMDPMNAEVWVDQNISSGGEYGAEGARLRLYGTERARTLEIVATGFSAD